MNVYSRLTPHSLDYHQVVFLGAPQPSLLVEAILISKATSPRFTPIGPWRLLAVVLVSARHGIPKSSADKAARSSTGLKGPCYPYIFEQQSKLQADQSAVFCWLLINTGSVTPSTPNSDSERTSRHRI